MRKTVMRRMRMRYSASIRVRQ